MSAEYEYHLFKDWVEPVDREISHIPVVRALCGLEFMPARAGDHSSTMIPDNVTCTACILLMMVEDDE